MTERSPSNPPAARTKLGLWTATALVVGNMVGSGIFLLPASLAPYRGAALLGWLVTAVGALVVATVFARLARRIPQAGGPYAYAREGFGDFAGFLMAWGYWISILATNAAISVAMVSYLTVFWPVLSRHRTVAAGVALGVVWLLTWINASGIRRGGMTQLATTLLKLVPLIAVGTVGWAFVDLENIVAAPADGQPLGSALLASVTLTLWAFLGLESATIPAENVADPRRTIPRATLLGTGLTAVIYIVSSSAVSGMLPAETLELSTAPFADAARVIWGSWGAYLVGIGAAVSCFGALNGWILVQGQLPMAMARDGLFPALFGRTAPDGTPSTAIVISSVLSSFILVLNYTRSLVELFTFAILLATITAVIPYAFASMSELKWVLRQKPSRMGRPAAAALASVAFLYSLWVIAGAGAEAVYWGFLLLLAGLPVYVVMRSRS
ncbi:MAG TPA: amino acid permease [Acidobacteriota bacterium]|nr:amino acid permease [Acidobacteriota bacterium]